MAGILHRCAQLPAAAGGGLAGAAALTKPQSRVRPMTLLFFRCKVLTRSLTRRRQDPGLDSARGMAHPRRRSKLLRPEGRNRLRRSRGVPTQLRFIHAAVGVHSASIHSRRVASSRPPLHSFLLSGAPPERAPLGLPWGQDSFFASFGGVWRQISCEWILEALLLYSTPPLTLVNALSRALDAPPETVSAWISAHGVSIIQPSFPTSCNRRLNRRELTRR